MRKIIINAIDEQCILNDEIWEKLNEEMIERFDPEISASNWWKPKQKSAKYKPIIRDNIYKIVSNIVGDIPLQNYGGGYGKGQWNVFYKLQDSDCEKVLSEIKLKYKKQIECVIIKIEVKDVN